MSAPRLSFPKKKKNLSLLSFAFPPLAPPYTGTALHEHYPSLAPHRTSTTTGTSTIKKTKDGLRGGVVAIPTVARETSALADFGEGR